MPFFGHKTWNLKKVPEVAYGPSFYPMGSKLSLFSLYESWFPRYRLIFKIGHIWAWNLGVGQSCTYTFFLLQGVEIDLIFGLWAAVSKIWADFQNGHIWARNLPISQTAKCCTYSLSIPGSQNWAYFHSTGSGVWDTGQFSNLPYLGMKLGLGQSARSCTNTLFLS